MQRLVQSALAMVLPLSASRQVRRCALALSASLVCSGAVLAAGPPPAAEIAAGGSTTSTDKQDYSPAERLLFMTPHLAGLRPPGTLRYALRKSGSLEAGFDDTVAVQLSAATNGTCCNSSAEFMTGARRLPLPDVDGADGNPVLMYFLEHDLREMQRLTKGSQNHFRKRIRMAIYANAQISSVKVPYRGRQIDGTLVAFSPYLDDPNRARFEKLARKEYRFVLADAVPGGVYAIRTQIVDGTPGASPSTAPLITEELLAEGAQSLAGMVTP